VKALDVTPTLDLGWDIDLLCELFLLDTDAACSFDNDTVEVFNDVEVVESDLYPNRDFGWDIDLLFVVLFDTGAASSFVACFDTHISPLLLVLDVASRDNSIAFFVDLDVVASDVLPIDLG